MKRFALTRELLVTLALMIVCGGTAAAEQNYVGADSCKMCHKKAEKGDQYGSWKQSGHAGAYEVLASDKAKEIAVAKGIGNPQENGECLKCHVTGYGLDASRYEKKYTIEEGVACESCHGPGGDYKNIKIMKDVEQAKANGLIIPTEGTCSECHNEESPTFEGFDFEESYAEIAHPNPERSE